MDNSVFETIASGEFQNVTTLQTIFLTASKAYRYFRLIISSAYSSNKYAKVIELDIHGYKEPDT